MSADEISLRPLSLRPGGKNANPFAGFGKGAGFAVKKQVCVVIAVIPVDRHWQIEVMLFCYVGSAEGCRV